jgi:hypothetical protein
MWPDTYKGTDRDSGRSINEMLSKKIAERLELKVGAQVVLLRNISDTLANGSRGVVSTHPESIGHDLAHADYLALKHLKSVVA